MKLHYFQTKNKLYGVSSFHLNAKMLKHIDEGGMLLSVIELGIKPRGFPPLKPGECIPVELVPAKAKKKKVRKL